MRERVEDPRQEDSWPIFRSFKFWSIVVAVGLLLLFTFQNGEQVEIHLLIWEFTASGAFLVLAAAALGFSLGWVLRSARGPGFSLFG